MSTAHKVTCPDCGTVVTARLKKLLLLAANRHHTECEQDSLISGLAKLRSEDESKISNTKPKELWCKDGKAPKLIDAPKDPDSDLMGGPGKAV